MAFNERTVLDTNGCDNPRVHPAGMPHVLENGAFVVGNGVMTGTGPGRASGPLEAVSERRSQDGWFPKRFSYPRTSDCWIKAAWGVDVSRP